MTRFEKYLVWGSTAAVSVSGFGYAGVKYLLEPSDPFAIVNHPLQPWLLKAHVLTAPVFMFAIGLIAMRHIWPHFRARLPHGRRSGTAAALVLVPMVASGYLIQTVTHTGWLLALVIAHLVTGTLFALGAAAHKIATGARQRDAARRQAAAATEAAGSNAAGDTPLRGSLQRRRTRPAA
ncbi:MAG TPA: hypothetical protein VK939_08395 [Longimicrobiales bacterium]|nr:hypothetical protein [Longimicrobiales bacterium]